MTYDVGDQVRIFGSFKLPDGTPANPSTVTVYVKEKAAAVQAFTTPTVVNDAPGEYHLDFDCTAPGDFKYDVVGTGAVKASEPGGFKVRQRATG